MIEAKLTLIVILVGLCMSGFFVMIVSKFVQAFRTDVLKQLTIRNNLLSNEVEQYRTQVTIVKGQLAKLRAETDGSLATTNQRLANIERELSQIAPESAQPAQPKTKSKPKSDPRAA